MNSNGVRAVLFAYCVSGLLLSGSRTCRASVPAIVADSQIPLASNLSYPEGVAISDTGIIYVADTNNNRVVTVSASGTVTTLSISGFTLDSPGAVAVDPSGDLFIADSKNSRVLEVSVSGNASVVAASPTLLFPISLTADSGGNVYVGDGGTGEIYKIAPGGSATEMAIGGLSSSFPQALLTDVSGDLYIADGNSNKVYKLTPGATSVQDVTPNGFTLSSPSGLATDAEGDLFVLDGFNLRIIEVPQGDPENPYLVPITGLNTATNLAADPAGNLYVADVGTNSLTQIIYSGNAVNLGSIALGSTGSPVAINYELNSAEALSSFKVTIQGDADNEATIGTGTTCQFQSYNYAPPGSSNPITPSNPFDCIAMVQGSPAYVGVRNGAINLLGSSNTQLVSVPFTESGTASAAWIFPATAQTVVSGLSLPQGIAISGQNGTVYIADQNAGKVYSWKGSGSTATAISTSPVTLSEPTGVALNGAGDLFIADNGLGKIVVVPANTAIAPYILATGSFLIHPISLICDRTGDIYVGDSGPQGINATSASPGFLVKIPAIGGPIAQVATAPVNVVYPQTLAFDASGELYIGDGGPISGPGEPQIVIVPQNGTTSVLNVPGLVDPGALAVDAADDLWVIDEAYLNQITILPPHGGALYTIPLTAPTLNAPSGMVFSAGGNSLLVADLTQVVAAISGSQTSLNFPQTAVGSQSGPLVAGIISTGTSGIKAVSNSGQLYSYAGATQDFQVGSSSTCLSFTELLPTQACSFTATFAPVTSGALSENIMSSFNTSTQVELTLNGAATASSVTVAPAFSPNSGTFSTSQSVTISDATPGAVIYYTTDNSTPTTSSAVYQNPLDVTATTTINAIGVASGYSPSAVASATYTFTPYLGDNDYSYIGADYANYINATYAVTGDESGGYTVTSCSFYQPTGTVTQGAKMDCGLILAPTATTKSSSWLCHAAYTNPSSSGLGGWITLPLTGCGTLPAAAGYWVSTDSNDSIAGFPYGFSACGGSCNGPAPTSGNGTYSYRFAAANYGVYSGLGTAMTETGTTYQASQYVTLGPYTPSQTASPSFSVASGNYATAQTITIADVTPGATIYYTTDGTTPTLSSPVYQGALTITTSTTLNAFAVAAGDSASGSASATYTFSPYLGTNAYSTAGTDSANYINATYAVTGTSAGGYTATSCSFYQPTGMVTKGAKLDCGLILAPTPTTQSSSWLCHGTYANASSSGLGGWITVSLSGCGVLPANTAYWVAIDNNDPHTGFPYGLWNCGGTCNGSAPTFGTGTYPYRYIAATYGQYTGLGTDMSGGATAQGSQFVTLGIVSSAKTALPTLSPGTGTYLAPLTVNISDVTSGAVIYYTVDGSSPTTVSDVYSGPISVSGTTTINAMAIAPGYSASVVAAATYTFHPYLGTNMYSTNGTDYENYINATYAVTSSNPHGYTASSCSFYQPTGGVTKGAKLDCGVILAPTPTTQASSWLCHGTYTNPSAQGAGAWITVALSGCGTLPASTAYWIATDSNDPIPGFPYGDWNCGTGCNGNAPTVGAGTYPYAFIGVSYGSYTGMSTAMTLNTAGYQASQFVDLTAVP